MAINYNRSACELNQSCKNLHLTLYELDEFTFTLVGQLGFPFMTTWFEAPIPDLIPKAE